MGLMVSAGTAGTGAAAESPGEDDAPAATAAIAPSEQEALLEHAARLADFDDFAPQRYEYRSAGRRDPFVSLLADDDEEDLDGLPGIGDIYIVGILWGEKDRFALAETRHGRSLVLREGDKLRDGRVIAVRPDGVTVRQHYYGMSRRVELPIVSGEEVGDER
jgi:hypothetical protein